MLKPASRLKKTLWYKIFSILIISILSFSLAVPPSFAQMMPNLPPPGSMVHMSPGFTPAIIRGMKIFADNPLQFDFIVDRGDSGLKGDALKSEGEKLIKYFMAALTVPEEELWVNLSPYEEDKIIPQSFGITDMGRDLLAQDYILKQLTSSLMYPEDQLGKKFWDRVYKKANELFGTTEIPINTFNKVWIVPDKAVVFEQGDMAFIAESHLKVMLEEDYLSMMNNLGNKERGTDRLAEDDVKTLSNASSQIVKEVLIPEIEKEVNEGKNFAGLRQIYNSMILATWYKVNLKESLLGQVYANQNKTLGIDIEDKESKQKIYEQYLAAFKKGVYNYIKEDVDPATKEVIPRKYFSGGFISDEIEEIVATQRATSWAMLSPRGQQNIRLVEQRAEDNQFDAFDVRLYDLGSKAVLNRVQPPRRGFDNAMLSPKVQAMQTRWTARPRNDVKGFARQAILEDKVVLLQGTGGIGGLELEPLLESGAKVIAADVDPDKVAKLEIRFKNHVDLGRLFVFVEEKQPDGNFTAKIMNPFEHFRTELSDLGIERADIFIPAANGSVLTPETVEQLRQAGVRLVAGPANNALQLGNKDNVARLMKERNITYVVDYIINGGGVTAVNGHLGEDLADEVIAQKFADNVSRLIDYADENRLTTEEAARKMSADFIRQLPLAPAINKQQAAQQINSSLTDGTTVRVLTEEDLPSAEIKNLWDDHYAVFEIKNSSLGYSSYVAIHRLTPITSRANVINGQYRATGGTRILNYPTDIAALNDALELAREMSFKNAGAGLKIGGSKSVINVQIDPRSDGADQERRSDILKSYAQAVETIGRTIGGGVLTGQDMNISEDDARLMFQHAPTSIVPYVAGDLSQAPTRPTAIGVYAGLAAAAKKIFQQDHAMMSTLQIGQFRLFLAGKVQGLTDTDLRRIERSFVTRGIPVKTGDILEIVDPSADPVVPSVHRKEAAKWGTTRFLVARNIQPVTLKKGKPGFAQAPEMKTGDEEALFALNAEDQNSQTALGFRVARLFGPRKLTIGEEISLRLSDGKSVVVLGLGGQPAADKAAEAKRVNAIRFQLENIRTLLATSNISFNATAGGIIEVVDDDPDPRESNNQLRLVKRPDGGNFKLIQIPRSLAMSPDKLNFRQAVIDVDLFARAADRDRAMLTDIYNIVNLSLMQFPVTGDTQGFTGSDFRRIENALEDRFISMQPNDEIVVVDLGSGQRGFSVFSEPIAGGTRWIVERNIQPVKKSGPVAVLDWMEGGFVLIKELETGEVIGSERMIQAPGGSAIVSQYRLEAGNVSVPVFGFDVKEIEPDKRQDEVRFQMGTVKTLLQKSGIDLEESDVVQIVAEDADQLGVVEWPGMREIRIPSALASGRGEITDDTENRVVRYALRERRRSDRAMTGDNNFQTLKDGSKVLQLQSTGVNVPVVSGAEQLKDAKAWARIKDALMDADFRPGDVIEVAGTNVDPTRTPEVHLLEIPGTPRRWIVDPQVNASLWDTMLSQGEIYEARPMGTVILKDGHESVVGEATKLLIDHGTTAVIDEKWEYKLLAETGKLEPRRIAVLNLPLEGLTQKAREKSAGISLGRILNVLTQAGVNLAIEGDVFINIVAAAKNEPAITEVQWEKAREIRVPQNLITTETPGQLLPQLIMMNPLPELADRAVSTRGLVPVGQVDRAMMSNVRKLPGQDEVGGIDLNPALLDLQIKRDGNGVPLPLPQQPIGDMRIDGFLPVIINIVPVTSLPLLSGIEEPQEKVPELSSL